MIVAYWYSILSVTIVLTSAIVSIYILCKNETIPLNQNQNQVKHSLYQSLVQTAVLINPNDNDLHQLVQSDSITSSACTDTDTVTNTTGCWPRSQQLWTSCWRGLHPAFLLLFRVLSFFVLAFFLSWDVHQWSPSIFIFYYTEWAYSLVMLYFAIGSVVSAHGCWLYYKHKNTSCIESVEGLQGRDDLEGNPEKGDISSLPFKLQRHYYQEQDAQRAGFWGYLMQISYQISAGAVILTDIIFWCFIVPFVSNSHLGLNLLMACIHSVNFALLLLETSINHLPFPYFRLAYFVLWSSAYVMFQWIIHLCGYTWWPYPFLKLSTPLTPLWYFLMAVFHVVCYGVYALIVKAKDSVFSKLFPHSYMRSY